MNHHSIPWPISPGPSLRPALKSSKICCCADGSLLPLPPSHSPHASIFDAPAVQQRLPSPFPVLFTSGQPLVADTPVAQTGSAPAVTYELRTTGRMTTAAQTHVFIVPSSWGEHSDGRTGGRVHWCASEKHAGHGRAVECLAPSCKGRSGSKIEDSLHFRGLWARKSLIAVPIVRSQAEFSLRDQISPETADHPCRTEPLARECRASLSPWRRSVKPRSEGRPQAVKPTPIRLVEGPNVTPLLLVLSCLVALFVPQGLEVVLPVERVRLDRTFDNSAN